MSRPTYIPIDAVIGDDILRAEYQSGKLLDFGTDANGRRWLKRMPEIHAVPKEDDLGLAAEYGFVDIGGSEGDDKIANDLDDESPLRNYRRLVELRAKGTDIPHDLGFDILDAAGKTMDDFNANVAEVADILLAVESEGDDE